MKLNFDATKVDPIVGLPVLPADDYAVKIIEEEERQNKENDGSHLALTLEVLEGKYAGRKLFHNVNLGSLSESGREFAAGTLSAICHATGVMQLEDTAELVGIPMVAEVRVTNQKVYGKSNTISAYKAAGTASAAGDDAGDFFDQ